LDLVVRDVGDVVEQVDRDIEYGFVDQPGLDAEGGEFDRPIEPRDDRSGGKDACRRQDRSRHDIWACGKVHGAPIPVDVAQWHLKLNSENLSSPHRRCGLFSTSYLELCLINVAELPILMSSAGVADQASSHARLP